MIHSSAAGGRLLKFVTGAVLMCAGWLVVPHVVLAEPQMTQHYVSSAGADTSGCGTLGSPCKTISYLLPSVSTGDQISVTSAITDNFTLDINVTIAGAPGASIDGSGMRIITVDAGVSASLSNLTLRNGGGSQDGGLIHNAGALAISNATLTGGVLNGRNGGAIYNTGNVTITGSVITDNEAQQGYGGGIENEGVVFISNSTISNNRADSGGGIDNFADGEVHVQRAVVMGNSAASGAGIYNDFGSPTRVWLTDTAVVSNSASNEAGGIFNGGRLSLANVTVSNNHLNNGEGVAIDHRSGPLSMLSMLNVTIAANTVANADDSSAVHFAGAGTIQNSAIANGGLSNCSGGLNSAGYNLSSDNTCSFLDQATDMEDVEAQLGALQHSAITYDTYTNLPLRGSLLINRIPVAMCSLADDQRGVSRPQGDSCDVGAHEVVPADLSLTATAAPASLPAGTPLTVTLNVTNTGPAIAAGVVVTSDLPAGVGLQGCTGATSCVASGSQLTATLGTLGVGGNALINVRLIPQQSGELVVGFVSASDEWDQQTANNSATASASVTKSADLSVSLKGAPVVQPHATFTLTAEVQNRGEYAADSPAFTMTLPADVSFVSAIGPSWDCELHDSTVTCAAQTSLAASAVSQVVITLQSADVPAQLYFVGNAASNTSDPDITNNTTAMTMTVRSGSTIALPIVLR